MKQAERFLPDVVFLDIGMPTLDGHETAKLIRQQPWGQQMVLVALTGMGTERRSPAIEGRGLQPSPGQARRSGGGRETVAVALGQALRRRQSTGGAERDGSVNTGEASPGMRCEPVRRLEQRFQFAERITRRHAARSSTGRGARTPTAGARPDFCRLRRRRCTTRRRLSRRCQIDSSNPTNNHVAHPAASVRGRSSSSPMRSLISI